MAQNQNSMEELFGFSFPSNSLLTVQLMKENSQPSMNNGYVDNRPKHFFFVNVVGSGNNGSDRAYDFKNNSVAVKYSIHELGALAKVLEALSRGNKSEFGNNYSKFAKSQAGNKMVSAYGMSNNDKKNQYEVDWNINLTAQLQGENQMKNTVIMSPADAFSLSKALFKLHDKALELEIERQLGTPKFSGNQSNQQKATNPSPGPSAPKGEPEAPSGGGSPFDEGAESNDGGSSDVMSDAIDSFENTADGMGGGNPFD